eukprot:9155805-Alexandrium_andersonii.AAC.1
MPAALMHAACYISGAEVAAHVQVCQSSRGLERQDRPTDCSPPSADQATAPVSASERGLC